MQRYKIFKQNDMLGTPFSVCTLSLHKKSNHFKNIIRSLKMVVFFTFLYKQVLVLEKQVLGKNL